MNTLTHTSAHSHVQTAQWKMSLKTVIVLNSSIVCHNDITLTTADSVKWCQLFRYDGP